MLIIRPQPRSFMAGSARRIRWNGADRLTASACSQRSGRKLVDRREMPDNGVVDEYVDGAAALEQVGHHGLDRFALG